MGIQGEGRLQINTSMARRLGIGEGDTVRLVNERGQATTSVTLSNRVPDDVAWFPEHFDQAVRVLFSSQVDTQTGVPVWKTADVMLETVRECRTEGQP